jgi:hypothetical protein
MSEYRLVLPKTAQGGFAESPQQDINNASSPMLNQPLTTKNAIGLGVAVMYGKQVVNAGYQAVVGQLGNKRLEDAITYGTKAAGYIALGIATGGTVVAVALAAEAATIGITYAVESHAQNLENERTIITRGARVNYNAGGYYG